MKITLTPTEASSKGIWGQLCEVKGWEPYCWADGLVRDNEEISLTEEEATELNLLPTPTDENEK